MIAGGVNEAVSRCAAAAVRAVVEAAKSVPLPRAAPFVMPRAGSVVTVPILDSDGSRVTGREETGFVFRVIRNSRKPEGDCFALVFPDRSWAAFREAEWADKWISTDYAYSSGENFNARLQFTTARWKF